MRHSSGGHGRRHAQSIGTPVAGSTDAQEHTATAAGQRARVVAGVLQSVPGRLQGHSVLRVGGRRFPHTPAEKTGIELLNVGQGRSIRQRPIRHAPALDLASEIFTLAEKFPEIIGRVRSRESTPYADDRDRVFFRRLLGRRGNLLRLFKEVVQPMR